MMPLIVPEKRQTTQVNPPAPAERESDVHSGKTAAIPQRYSEKGYLLASVTILILIVVSILSSAAFVSTREGRFKENFATGERLASLAIMAHAYTQNQHYTNGSTLNSDVLASMNLPDNFSFTPLVNTSFSAEVIARDEMPVAGTSTTKAASAYIHLRIRPKTGNRNPTDTVALQAGANRGGMGRFGFFKTAIPAGDLCDGADTVVRWGLETDSCLNQAQSDALFSDIQPGDIVAPAWETALVKMDRDALMRFPQPGRPDLNAMTTALTMNVNDISNARNLASQTMIQPATGTTGIGNGDATDKMIVQSGKNTNFKQPVTAVNGLVVSSSGGQPMIVDNAVTINFGSNVTIAETLSSGGTPLNLNVADIVSTQNVGTEIRDLNISSRTAPLNVGVKRVLVAPKQIQITGPNGRLAVSGALNTTSTALNSTHVYAGRLDTFNNTVLRNTGGSLVNVNAQSLDQKGDINSFTAGTVTIRTRCDGLACPNNSTVKDPPPPLN